MTRTRQAQHRNQDQSMTEFFTIRCGTTDDLAAMKELFVESVRTICIRDYDAEQISAWVSGSKNEVRWQMLIPTQYVLVAQNKTGIIGFITMTPQGHIDLLYTHKSHQRRGVASQLLKKVEHHAQEKGLSLLTVDASKTAKPFFAKHTFEIIQEQTVIRNNIHLTNYKMHKKINESKCHYG